MSTTDNTLFKAQILQGIPSEIPSKKAYPKNANQAPRRKDILTLEEKKLAIKNALRYFPKEWHAELSVEFAEELKEYGRIYMHSFKPDYEMHARPISEYPAKIQHAAAIMLMIQNNLDAAVAQHPEELNTYGENGAGCQNWAQDIGTMQ